MSTLNLATNSAGRALAGPAARDRASARAFSAFTRPAPNAPIWIAISNRTTTLRTRVLKWGACVQK